ncbi:MAG TPA: glycosyltransferase [Rhizomicrobium sp.]|nr:glycosyltransferase [Rhizomicrobium sp.]
MPASDLELYEPEYSARRVVTCPQAIALGGVLLGSALAFALAPGETSAAVSGALGAWFVANAAFRVALLAAGARVAQMPPVPPLADDMLPVYSILVPLFHEAEVVPSLLRALSALDYPRDRLDIKLIVEADDAQTAAALQAHGLDAHFTIVVVPEGYPRTKPRACNHALLSARGELLVIYDAEDRPDPDQLRKAAALFRASGNDVACLQARLNFFNAHENILTKLFALDYALWFDHLLPGLERLGIAMPLGGTSNHFRIGALRAIHGWDPFNVTEDADIGIRLARHGYRVRTLDSTTFEEAPNDVRNWLKQRSRWQKGYMQTWLVHMRHPLRLLRSEGWLGFLGFQLFIGGTFASAFLGPVLWTIFAAILISGPALAGSGQLCLACLVIGNGFFVLLKMLGVWRRRWFGLAPYGLLAPLYWMLISLAFLRALGQLVSRPFHWEKTRHGVSRFA